MLGLDNPVHILYLLIVMLLVFGAKRLPEMGRSLGTGMRGFKDALSGEGSPPPELSRPAQHAPAPVGHVTSAPSAGEPRV